jgi:hypothetical protein
MKIMVKWQTIIYFQQAFYQQYNNKVKNSPQCCEKNLINNINLMIHYNHIENFLDLTIKIY